MLIAIDLDEVLVDTLSGVIAFHNATYGTSLEKKHFFSYRWWEVWGGTREESIDKFLLFAKSDYFTNLQPLEDALASIEALAKDHTLIVITSRQNELEVSTKQWITKHFPQKFKEVYIINHADWSKGGKTTTKLELCQRLGVEVLIEDNLEYANECASSTAKVFLLDYPWNQGKTKKGVLRVTSWQEILTNLK